jgi:hypothetical protein
LYSFSSRRTGLYWRQSVVQNHIKEETYTVSLVFPIFLSNTCIYRLTINQLINISFI